MVYRRLCSPIIQCVMRECFITNPRLPFFLACGRGNYVFQPFLSNSPLRFLTALDTEPPFFHNIVTAFRGTASTLFYRSCFLSPSSPSFFPLFVRSRSAPSLSIRRISRLPFPLPPAAHHVLQYRRAASGVTPVIRDGPDEAFIILSKRVSLSIRQHTVIIQSNG